MKYTIYKENLKDGVHIKWTLVDVRRASIVTSIDASIDSNCIVNSEMAIKHMISLHHNETRMIKGIDMLKNLEAKLKGIITDENLSIEIRDIFERIYKLNDERNDYEIINVKTQKEI